ncbi:Histidine kinase [Rhodovastum atsumiense]|uniref:histidine kinase n=1 Tax=Rhodovastum atsumiense TaxID=504468 RepID=A0A5M6IS24_9PROT|nr:PAS domain-containing protein [Rhodovastum atsumiense]KAA5611094.1 PAS domain-containing protein [Rhodovastum atsumiense]CAH2599157.1 Histidine kinase [Rhodovastum atsumiense]
MKSLFGRLLLITGLALLPALAFQLWTEIGARDIRRQAIHDEALRLVHIASSEQVQVLEGARQLMTALVNLSALRGHWENECAPYFPNLLQQFPRYAAVAGTDRDGRVICSSRPGDIGNTVVDRTYFTRAMAEDGLVVGDYAIGRGSGRPSVHFAQRYRNPDGRIAGVITIALDLGWLQQRLDSLPLPRGASAFITDANGTILARRPEPGRHVGQPVPERVRRLLDAPQTGVGEAAGLDGITRIYAYAPIHVEPDGFGLGVGLDRDATFAALSQEQYRGLLLLGLSVALAMAITAAVAGPTITRPMGRLLAAAARWRDGDFSARTGLGRQKSEFGRLGAAFDAVAEAAEARERALRSALESTGDSVFVLSPDWHFTFLNRQAQAQIAGQRTLIGQVIWDSFPEAAGGPFRQALRRCMAERMPTQAEQFHDPLGRHLAVRAFPSDDGSITVFCRDVTEQRRTAARLAEREEMLRALGEATPDLLYAKDRAGRLLYANPAALAVLGRPFEAVRGQTAAEYATDATVGRTVLANDLRIMARGETETLDESAHDAQHGETRHWKSTKTPLRDPETGEVVGLVGISHDVTEQRRAEQALRENEARLRDLVETLDLGTFMAREPDGIIRVWSKGAERLYGWTAAEAIGRTSDELLRTVFPIPRAEVTAALEHEGEWSGDLRQRTRDGRQLVIAARKVLRRGADGRPLMVLEALTDTTAQRRAEADLAELNRHLEERVRAEVLAREEAQQRAAHGERLQALGQLAGGIAHDFNNILQAVQTGAGLIAHRAADPESVRRFSRTLLNATERGAAITRRLLAFARRGELRAERIDPLALLEGLRDVLAHTLGSPITVRLEVGPELRELMADRGQLETVLVNLGTNARDAMPEGGTLTLGAMMEEVARPAHPEGLNPGTYVRFSVTDTGTGMDPATLARALEPFFTTKPLDRGTGLGLSMARGFAEQSGGTLAIESTPGRGTTVTLWLPTADGRIMTAEPRPDFGSASPRARRVLVVDDEDVVRETLAVGLEDAGFVVLTAQGGVEALALLEAGEEVDTLISDLSMPGLSGIALIREAQARHPGLPAVLLTGYMGESAQLAMGGAMNGPFSMLRKPVTVSQIAEKVAALLAIGEYRAE